MIRLSIKRAWLPFPATAAAIALASAFNASAAQCRAALTAGSARETIIADVTVIPMDTDRELRGRSVLIRDGKIARIDSGAVQAGGATRIDGRGCYLIPGLIDMHVHLYDAESFPSYLKHGITTIANLNGSERVLDYRRRVNEGRLLGPAIVTAGPSIDGAPALNATFVSVNDTTNARAAVRRQRAAGYDFVKVYSNLSVESYRAIISEAARQHIAVVGHAPLSVGIDSVLVSGQSNVAHIEEFFQNPVADSHFVALAAAAKRSGVTVTPNLIAYADYLRSIADLPRVLADPEMRFASPASLSEKLPSNNRSIRPNPDQFAALLRQRQARFYVLTKLLSDNGVPLFTGTDTEIFGLAGTSAQLEMRELHQAGLTPFQVLRATTAAPGAFLDKILGQTQGRGQIKTGASADLVLLDADPLQRIENADAVRGVLLRGRWLPVSELDRKRDSIAKADLSVRRATVLFDSLFSAGKLSDATDAVIAEHRANPSVPALAEVVISRYSQRALRQGANAAAIHIARLGTLLYPTSAAAYRELARTELAAADTAEAHGHLAQALRMEPSHVWAQEAMRRLPPR